MGRIEREEVRLEVFSNAPLGMLQGGKSQICDKVDYKSRR